ncbi:MAG: hypothetical protein IV090_15005 [Candidatus Sericytochromatia bacterium]|nr:hypothetical protein [Candidatus Sericytochromatia bacterium]
MAGGDSHVILNSGVGTIGMANALNAVDANSVKSGNMTEPREVTDKTGKTQTLYFTDEGAKLFDKYSDPNNSATGDGPRITVEKDPSGISSLWKGIVKKEEGVGKPA